MVSLSLLVVPYREVLSVSHAMQVPGIISVTQHCSAISASVSNCATERISINLPTIHTFTHMHGAAVRYWSYLHNPTGITTLIQYGIAMFSKAVPTL